VASQAQVDKLVELLKGLPDEAVATLTKQAQATVDKAKAQAEAKQKLEQATADIKRALNKIASEVPNFDVKVRNGEISVHLVGVSVGGRSVSSPKSTPIRDSGMSMRELVQTYTPNKMSEFNDGDSNTKYRLALAALKVKQQQEQS